MTYAPPAQDRESLYALSWSYAQDGKFAIDVATGLVVDANPAAQALMGYSREELIGMHVTLLHPEGERGEIEAEIQKTKSSASTHSG